jgi:hypothetical protein
MAGTACVRAFSSPLRHYRLTPLAPTASRGFFIPGIQRLIFQEIKMVERPPDLRALVAAISEGYRPWRAGWA